MTTLAEHIIVAVAENRPPMLDMTIPLIYPTIEEDGKIHEKKYAKLTEQEKLQDDCYVQATNIVLQGLPPDVYSFVNHCKAVKDIWDRVKLLMQGTKLSYQERKCKLYNEFDKFTSVKGVSLHEYYLRFAQLIDDMHTIGMTMQQVQLAKNMYNTNYDKLYAYLSQHEGHENEVRMMHERYSDPLALVANYPTQSNSAQYPQQLSSLPQQAHSFQPYLQPYEAPHHTQPYQHAFQNQISHTPPSVHQNVYHTPLIAQQPQVELPQLDSGLAVPSFLPGDDLIYCLNKAMEFMSTVMTSHFPSTNNQLRISSNLRNQATIQDGRVTVQQVKGRQGQSFAGTGNKGNAISSRGNNTTGQARVVKCYNYQGEGHMARQCTKPKRLRNSAWFKEKMLLVQAQESGQVLEEEQLAFLVDPGVADGQATQTTLPQNVIFQTDDLDAYDSDCDDISSTKAVLMANLSDNEITSDSNIISYDQYLQEMQNAIVQHTNSSAQQDSMIISMFEQMSEQESKEKENKYMDKEIDLEKKIKELDNIVYKVGQSAQTVYMLTKPQVFYDDTHKQAIRYQNPFYLKKAQWIKPTLYDGIVISKKHDVIFVVDEEETLLLEEECR
ncbi:retrovirus-related pol polyprotein from transposon TNT 1-94 [Tanacetum coccineum]